MLRPTKKARVPAVLVALASALAVAGCSSPNPGDPPLSTAAGTPPEPTRDAAVRQAPVVVGRPARVFIAAGVGSKCEQLAPPRISITQPPSKGELSFIPNQETIIQTSTNSACLGQKTKGTGIYYTARAGTQGTDRFSISAILGSGEAVPRVFEVTITE